MEQASSSKINPLVMKRFVSGLCRVTKKYEERDIARLALDEQVYRAKRVSLSPQKNKLAVLREFENLSRMMGEVIAREVELLRIGREDSLTINILKEKLMSLENELKISKSKGSKELAPKQKQKKEKKIDIALEQKQKKEKKIDVISEQKQEREKKIDIGPKQKQEKEVQGKIKEEPREDLKKKLYELEELKKKLDELELKLVALKLGETDVQRLNQLEKRIDSIKSIVA